MFISVLFLNLIFSVFSAESVNWALLVAGSNEYYNYRHQADVCHAYQILHKYGIPDERIVVMMYDDIAENTQNPTKGVIINRPNGTNVYEGVIKDYTKEHVTPKNFLKILQGEKMIIGSKKTIESGPEDNIFVFFSDHGAPGLIAFPEGTLHASDLNKAIKNMHVQKKYKNMVFYIEACESGSMFEKLLPENINVFVTTASNPDESSYACYYDDFRDTYLGDLYSVNWMEDSDRQNTNIFKETLNSQFELVRNLTNASHVMEYGNLTMSKSFFVSDFQAEKSFESTSNEIFDTYSKSDAIKSEDVRTSILERKIAKETDSVKKERLLKELDYVNRLKRKAKSVITEIAGIAVRGERIELNHLIENKMKLINHECYVPVVDKLFEKCFDFKNEYVLRNLYILVNLCESGLKSEKLIKTIENVCHKKLTL